MFWGLGDRGKRLGCLDRVGILRCSGVWCLEVWGLEVQVIESFGVGCLEGVGVGCLGVRGVREGVGKFGECSVWGV